jgi:hypothetical protein
VRWGVAIPVNVVVAAAAVVVVAELGEVEVQI